MRVLSFPPAYPPGQSPYDVFKNRMSAILSIVGGIKGIIENKFINNQLKMIADNILNKVGGQKATDLSNLIMSPPPKEIYPDNLEDIVGQFVDKFAMGPMMKKETMMGKLPYPKPAMGPMMQKEIMTGGLPALGGVTSTAMPTVTPTAETMIPKMDIYQIYNAVKDLPSGEISWDNIYKKMTEKKPFWMGTTESEQYVLNQMLGQVTDPRTKITSDINLSKLVQEAFYPEEKRPGKYPYTEEEIKEFELWKASQKPDIKSILENIPEGFDISSFNVSTTGTTSFSFKPIDKTTPWEFDTWEEAQNFLKTHPQKGFIGKVETHDKGFDVTYQKGVTEGITKIVPTAGIIKNFKEDLLNSEYRYDEVYADYDVKYDLSKIKNIPTKADRAKKIYDFALKGDVKNYGIQDSGIVDKDGFVIDPVEYLGLYEEYEKAAREYYEATGIVLPKEYLSLKEAGIYTGFTLGKGYKGGYKPVSNTQNIQWSWLVGSASGTNKQISTTEEIFGSYGGERTR